MRRPRCFMNAEPALAPQLGRSFNGEFVFGIHFDHDSFTGKLRSEIAVGNRVELGNNGILCIENEIVDSAGRFRIFHEETNFHCLRFRVVGRNCRHLHPVEIRHLSASRRSHVRRKREDMHFPDSVEVLPMKPEVPEKNCNPFRPVGKKNLRSRPESPSSPQKSSTPSAHDLVLLLDRRFFVQLQRRKTGTHGVPSAFVLLH